MNGWIVNNGWWTKEEVLAWISVIHYSRCPSYNRSPEMLATRPAIGFQIALWMTSPQCARFSASFAPHLWQLVQKKYKMLQILQSKPQNANIWMNDITLAEILCCSLTATTLTLKSYCDAKNAAFTSGYVSTDVVHEHNFCCGIKRVQMAQNCVMPAVLGQSSTSALKSSC